MGRGNAYKMLIVVPCYNEELRLNLNYWRAVISENPSVSFVFVDDGSTDKTLNIIQKIGLNSKIISLGKNSGKSEAIRQGWIQNISQSKDWKGFGFIDSDGAFSLNDISNVIHSFKEQNHLNSKVDAVLSSRVALAGRTINRSKFRHYLGRIISTFINYNWSESPYDSQCGFKLFSNTEYFKQAICETFETRWFFDIELLLRIMALKMEALNIWEEPLMYWTEVAESKINTAESLRIFKEMLKIKSKIRATIGVEK